jgi:hypothetical protein
METTIEVNDAIEEENVETNYETPAKKKAKRTQKIKPLPEELAVLKDCPTDWENLRLPRKLTGIIKVNNLAKS